MGRRSNGALPQIRKHKSTGYYYIWLRDPAGKRKQAYLGKISDGIGKARQRYYAIIRAMIDAQPHSRPSVFDVGNAKVRDVCEKFLDYALQRYVKHGRSTGTYERYRMVLSTVDAFYGWRSVRWFGLSELINLRNYWLRVRITRNGNTVPLSRTTVNDRVAQVITVFKRARQWGLVPKEVLWDLRDLEPLREYESTARETPPVRPAATEDIEAVIQELAKTNQTVADMVRVHALTGCRSTELCLMRPRDITRFPDGVWEYIPSESKNEHHDKGRIIPLGPKAQQVLEPYLEGLRKGAYVFSPRQAAEDSYRRRRETGTKHKKYKRVKERKVEPGSRYTHGSYRRCVQRAAARVGVKITPHQLRHAAATAIDQQVGKEAARIVLGHADIKTTDIYADYNRPLAHRTALELG